MESAADNVMEVLLRRQEAELKNLSASFVKVEKEYYELVIVNYDELDAPRKAKCDARLKRIKENRVTIIENIQVARRRVQTTISIISTTGGSSIAGPSSS